MRWSWKAATLAGIELRVHATFLLLLAWAALSYSRIGGGAAALRGVLVTLALFVSVVLHELGHALTAKRFGVPTQDITLLPIGGVARLSYIPRQPTQELLIALAGPTVTLAIIVVLEGIIRIFSLPNAGLDALGIHDGFVAQVMWVNAALLVFNLLPAFPMDGGRVLRAALASRTDYVRATESAARAARAVALFFGLIGLLYDPFLALIALFVWLGAAAEAADVQLYSRLAGIPVERLMIREIETLTPRDTLDLARRHVLAGFQQDFPVVDDGKVVGVLTRHAMIDGLARYGRDSLVDESMERTFGTATPEEPVEDALTRLRESRRGSLPVISEHRLAGLLTLENVGEFIMFESAVPGGRG